MVDVTESLTRKVAHLARLELTDEEVRLYTEQMKKTLGYIEQLNRVQVDASVVPMYHPLEIETPMRDDVVRAPFVDENGKPKVLKDAPNVLYDGFKVPPII